MLNPRTTKTSYSDIAVIGIACYYPGASNPKELWENILARRIQFRRMLNQRLPLDQYYDADPKAPDKTYLTKAAFLENFEFDWARRRIPRKTFESTDIVHWLALETAIKTFEDAGYKISDIPLASTGVIIGNTLTGEQTRSSTLRLRWPYVQKTLNAALANLGMGTEDSHRVQNEMEKIYKSAFYPITEDSLAGGLANTIAGRVCNYLNLKGGGYIVDGACSSSLLAVATASNALKLGEMDLVLAGGVDVSLDPFELVGFAKAGALAKDKMHVYDRRANGFFPGEGCGFVLLKRLEDAIRDQNNIYAVIKGWGISSDGRGGIMEPSSSGQATAIGRAYKDLDYQVSDVDFIEGHGTGTAKGDRVELQGIAAAVYKSVGHDRKRICGVTSFKSIVGHTKAAAGVGGLIKAVLAVNQRIIPATANCQQPHEVFEKDAECLFPVVEGSVISQDKPARAGISSAGFGGINCHMTIESKDAPSEKIKPKIDERALLASYQETEVFTFSARTVTQLRNIIEKFKEDLRFISVAEMADLAAFLNTKSKKNAPVKIAIVTDSPENLYEALNIVQRELQSATPMEGKVKHFKTSSLSTHIVLGVSVKKKRIGFLYPGQGSQRLNMTRRLFERFSWVRDLLELSSLPLEKYIFRATERFVTKEEREDAKKKLSQTEVTQPAVVYSSLVWTEFMSRLGIVPQSVGGHSLGELSAFYAAGALSKEALLKFAEARGKLMTGSGRETGGMMSLACSAVRAQELVKRIGGNLIVANINSPSQTVVSGGKKEIDQIAAIAKKENIAAHELNVSNAFHSSLMNDVAAKINRSGILPQTSRLNGTRLYSCIDGKEFKETINVKEYFTKQVVLPVHFIRLVEAMSKDCDLLVEVGPGRVLTDLVKAINKDGQVLCLPVESTPENDRDLNIVLAEIFARGIMIQWEELYRNRLIRPFVPASRKKFIENQCERPMKGLVAPQAQPVDIKMIGQGINISDDDLAEEETSKPAVVEGRDGIADLLVGLTQKVTGFDRASISLDLRLLDDLNLDSIKAAELIAEAAKSLGVAGELDPSQFSNQTLGQIRDRLAELAEEQKTAKAAPSTVNVLKRYQHKTWVRNFVVRLKPEEIITKDVNRFKNLSDVLILSELSEGTLVSETEKAFKQTKAKVSLARYGEISEEKLEKFNHIDCLIALLPRFSEEKPFDPMSLKRTIERLHKVIVLATEGNPEKERSVVFVQFGAGTFGETDSLKSVESASAKSIASTLHLERPDLRVRVVDLYEHIDDKDAVNRIVDELMTPPVFEAVGYDSLLARAVQVFEKTDPSSYKKRDVAWSHKDVVLVTGGAKGITAECALAFARTTKAEMVLVGRTPAPAGKDRVNEIALTLNRFKKENLKCRYFSCDITDEEEVGRLIKEIEKKVGTITGLLHGAGLNSLSRLKQATVAHAYQEALPKVMGALNVLNALGDKPPKFIMALTSVIGVTGMEGSGWYGFANEALNLALRQFQNKHNQTQIQTVAYSVWDEVGMGAKLGSLEKLSQKGIAAIPVDEGVKRFNQLIKFDPGTEQVIVVARIAGLDTWRVPQYREDRNFRFIENVTYVLPGVELIAQAHLNVKDDPYLLDHNWKGSLLFPVVFGLEAMTQAYSYLLGTEVIEWLSFTDVQLVRPISVNYEQGTNIEIHAQVLEKVSNKDSYKVKIDIYSELTNFVLPHFSAILEISNKTSEEKPIPTRKLLIQRHIELDVDADIYNRILFQGKLFQCITKLHELYYNENAKRGECVFTCQYNKTFSRFFKEQNRFKNILIGDPFLIDSIFQSMQIIISHEQSLPSYVEKIEVNTKQKGMKLIAGFSQIKEIDAEHYRGDAIGRGENGDLVIVKNCTLNVVESLPDNPKANDIKNPIERDRVILENVIRKYERELGVQFPSLGLTYIHEVHGMRKEKRHQAETPFMNEVVQIFLRKNNQPFKKYKIKWHANGKPFISSNSKSKTHISLAHDKNLVICAVGKKEQGTDIQTILLKTKEEWRSLLGNKKFEIVKDFSGEQLNCIATAILASNEVYIKTNQNSKSHEFKLEKILHKNCYIFQNGNDLFVNIFVQFTRGSGRLLTFLIREHGLFREPQLSEQLGFEKKYFHFYADYSGPQRQLVTIKKFPVTFKNNKLKSRRVYFSSYFDWIGEIREYALLPIYRQLAEVLETKEWGVATNNVILDIKGELRGSDIVEGRMWLGKKLNDNVYDLNFEFRKYVDENNIERVAFVSQRISWVKILGHGKAKVNRLPSFLEDIMQKMEPRSDIANSPTPLKELYAQRHFRLNNLLKNYERNALFLAETKILTTLEESNLVGNIYFANYSVWVGRTMDYYFYKLWPELYIDEGINNEFVCTQCKINHLNEAMPFDLIKVRMYLSKLFDNGIDLKYEIYANNNKKLAVASQSLLWIKRNNSYMPSTDKLPTNFINKIIKKN